MVLVFATNNKHKLSEIKKLLVYDYQIKSLEDISITEDIPETGSTLSENASQKSWYVFNRCQIDCFSDDTGLEIEALDNEPGVYSARYAGEEKSAQKNMEKVLNKMKNKSNRRARFRTVISLIIDKKEFQFEGVVNGNIITEPRGEKGFGYDPIFIPDGFEKTFAELDMDVKNKISHRGIATQKLVEFLRKI